MGTCVGPKGIMQALRIVNSCEEQTIRYMSKHENQVLVGATALSVLFHFSIFVPGVAIGYIGYLGVDYASKFFEKEVQELSSKMPYGFKKGKTLWNGVERTIRVLNEQPKTMKIPLALLGLYSTYGFFGIGSLILSVAFGNHLLRNKKSLQEILDNTTVLQTLCKPFFDDITSNFGNILSKFDEIFSRPSITLILLFLNAIH